MSLRPWVKRLINEALEFELFDVPDGRRSYAPAPSYQPRLQDVIPALDDLWRDCQAMEQWVKEKFDEIGRMDISEEDKVRKIFHIMYLAFVAMIKSWGDSDIPTQEEFREMVRPKFAALGFSI